MVDVADAKCAKHIDKWAQNCMLISAIYSKMMTLNIFNKYVIAFKLMSEYFKLKFESIVMVIMYLIIQYGIKFKNISIFCF